jgi:hypothetical protein
VAATVVDEEEGPGIRCFGAIVSASNGVLVGPCHDEGVGGVSMMERRRELGMESHSGRSTELRRRRRRRRTTVDVESGGAGAAWRVV